jgi:hypothetical protein
MMIREPIVAGTFYPADAAACRRDAAALVEGLSSDDVTAGRTLTAGLVPHAGWVYSGRTAARVFRALAAGRSPAVVVLLGGVHRYLGREAAIFPSGRWETPIGGLEIDARLCERILGHTNIILEDPHAHDEEHSLEVQAPLVKHFFPQARIVPIMVPPGEHARSVGESVAGTIQAYKYDAVVVGTTDLTHYGPRYGLVGHGIGAAGHRWAKEENDTRMIALIREMAIDRIVPEALQHKNACSSGAVAATAAAAMKLGATEGILLDHTSSSEVILGRTAQPAEDSVGYAGFVFA